MWPTNSAQHLTYLQSHPPQERQRAHERLLALVVSSDTEIQDSVRGRLRAQGHSIVCAPDLKKARAIVRQASPHLLIADLSPDELTALRPHLASSTTLVELVRASYPDDVMAALDIAQGR